MGFFMGGRTLCRLRGVVPSRPQRSVASVRAVTKCRDYEFPSCNEGDNPGEVRRVA